MKERLKKRWTEVYKRTKQKTAEGAKKEAEKDSSEGIKIPYFGEKGRKAIETGNPSRDFRIEKFVAKLQTPTEKDKDGKQVTYPKSFLLHAVEIAKELEAAIEEWAKTDEKAKADKFRQLISVFNEKERFRTLLLNREISASDLVRMKKEGFMSAQAQEDMEKATEAKI